MGLLDDAIREHLEFKRLHGADPGEVARQEHEALGPVRRDEDTAPGGQDEAPEGGDWQLREPASPVAGPPPAPAVDLAHPGEETIELDMRTVLATDQAVPAAPLPQGANSAASSAEDSLEWEIPGDSAPRRGGVENAEPHGDVPGPEGESVEDVLEETPDFLRETPDQERLWFEQQPPRDFDFER